MILLASGLLGSPLDPVALTVSLIQPHVRVRLLVRLAGPDDLVLAEALARESVAVELLVPAGMELPATTLPAARMPPGSTATDTDELALALSDVVLIGAVPPDLPLVRLVRKLDKRLLIPGAKLPALTGRGRSITYRLDPDQAGWHRMFRFVSGRLEQFLLELAAFNWQEHGHGGSAKSRGKLHACAFGRAWYQRPYFAPEGPVNWKDLVPDRTVLEANSPIVANFDRLDRSALLGAYFHRDMAWVAHMAAA